MGVCDGRLQNAPTQHTTKMIDYQSIQLCQSLKLWQSVATQKWFWDFLDSAYTAYYKNDWLSHLHEFSPNGELRIYLFLLLESITFAFIFLLLP